MDKKKFTFTNSVGDTFDLLPANPLEEELIRASILTEWTMQGKTLPELPCYEVETVTGEKQRIQVGTKEQAEQAGIGAAWAAYEQARYAFDAEYGERYMVACFLCVKADPEQYPLWKRNMKAKKYTLPEDEIERFLLFCKTWVIRSADDVPNFIIAVTRTMMNLSEEAQKAAEERFRAVMEAAAVEALGKGPAAG